MATRFKEINPATNKVWKLADMHAALIESRAQANEFKAIVKNQDLLIRARASEPLPELTWSDVQKRFIMPRVRRDLVERPLFAEDVRCGYRSLVQWIKEGYTELRKPVFH